ncbi:paraquat-inducible protein A [Aliikangiella sp. IMCC44359]|uniref:paraquat-inducible protein A n=1 Tax=Aliikangiella sp. IMCC44359 TaxID=3459125 RepID=UPI00403B2D42
MSSEHNDYSKKNEVVACHECDLLVNIPTIGLNCRVTCPRCGYVITRNFSNAQTKIFALSIAALTFLLLAIPFPFLSFSAQGNERNITLIQSIQSIAETDFNSIAVLILATTIIIPSLFLLGLIYVMISLKCRYLLPYTSNILRFLFSLLNWNMAEIFLVAILVSFIKIASLAKLTLGLSFIAYVLFILCLSATISHLDQYQAWRWIKTHE